MVKKSSLSASSSSPPTLFDFPPDQKTLLHRGFENEIWLINDSWQKKILRVCQSDTKSYSDLTRELAISRELQARHLPLTNIEQIGYYLDHDHHDLRLPAMLVNYIEGQPLVITPDSPPSLAQIKSAANLLAEIHLQTRNFPQHPATGSLNLFLEVGLVSPLKKLLKLAPQFQLFFPNDATFLSQLRQFLSRRDIPATRDVCWLHNDYRPENTLWYRQKLVGVIDLDYSIVGPRLYDLAQSLLLWSINSDSALDSSPDFISSSPINPFVSLPTKKRPPSPPPSRPIIDFALLSAFLSNYQANFPARTRLSETAELGWWLKLAAYNRTALTVLRILDREPFYPPRHLSDIPYYQASLVL